MGAELATDGAEFRGLAVDDREVFLFAQFNVYPRMDLVELPFAHDVRWAADEPACEGAVETRGEMKRVREEEVAQEHTRFGPPFRVHCGTVPAHDGTIQHVVVHERRGVNHLDDR